MKYFLDTEFIENGPGAPIYLLSIGMVSEVGGQLYAINSDAPLADANEWVREHVYPRLHFPEPGWPLNQHAPLAEIRSRILKYIGNDPAPEFWGYYADYDWVVFCQIFGRMIDLPKGWPMYCRDIKQLVDSLGNPRLPVQSPNEEHNALYDARWNRHMYAHLKAL